MKERYRLFRRENGIFYSIDTVTKQRNSLETTDRTTASRLIHAKNEAVLQPAINLQIAKAYLAAADPDFIKRDWGQVMAEFVKVKKDTNRTRAERAVMDKAFDSIRDLELIKTRPEHFFKVLESGKVSTNNYLRRFHNFAVDLGWLPYPVMPKRQWPAIRYKEKRAITREEHELILNRERNPEMRAFLRCCWHIGGSQSDVVHLKAEDVDWENQVVSFFRSKTGTAQIINIGHALGEVVRDLPGQGMLFPRLAAMDEKHRAALFQCTCRRVGVTGVSLHSYRYAWAERAKSCGYPERFAQCEAKHPPRRNGLFLVNPSERCRVATLLLLPGCGHSHLILPGCDRREV
jgi:integrase